MTPKIHAAVHRPEAPCPAVFVDLDAVAAAYDRLTEALPGVALHYAVKANPAAAILQRLVTKGASFDAASLPEVLACIAAGAAPHSICFGSTVKRVRDIQAAHARGVTLFAMDSEEELRKIAEATPGVSVYCRLAVDPSGACWPLGRKFGASAEEAVRLLVLARELGLKAAGLSFHVGSQQTDPEAWTRAIGLAGEVADRLRHQGVDIRLLNLGGGFPARYREDVPEPSAYGAAIRRALGQAFPRGLPALMAEPGRGLVAEAGALVSEVVLVSRRDPADPLRWVYLDVGRFGGLAEAEGEAIVYEILTPRDGETGPVIVAGPTCDSVDTLWERSGHRLPLDLRAGDRVILPSAGAYITSYAAPGFNGFPAPEEVFL